VRESSTEQKSKNLFDEPITNTKIFTLSAIFSVQKWSAVKIHMEEFLRDKNEWSIGVLFKHLQVILALPANR